MKITVEEISGGDESTVEIIVQRFCIMPRIPSH